MFEVGMKVQNTPRRSEMFGPAIGLIIHIDRLPDGSDYVETQHRSDEADWYLGDEEFCTLKRRARDIERVVVSHCECDGPIYVIDYLCGDCRA